MNTKKRNFTVLYIALVVLVSVYGIGLSFFASALANLLPKNFNPAFGFLVFLLVFIVLIVAQIFVQNRLSEAGNEQAPFFLPFIGKDQNL